MSNKKEKTVGAIESTKTLATEATATGASVAIATEEAAAKKAESVVDGVFDTVTAWAAKGLKAAKRGLEASARWLDARAKAASDLADKLQA